MPEGQVRLPQRDSPLLFALYFLAYLSVLIRLVLRPESEGVVGATAYGLMAAFLAFSVAQPPLSRRWPAWTHLNLALQCAVVIALFMTEPTIDFYGILCIALSIVAVRDLEAAASLVWLVILCVTVTLGLIVAFGPLEALNYITVYVVGCLLFGLYGRVSRKAESARARSEALLAELADAHRRLREYAERAEEAAAAQERAHLAGELHDAATQTVFSMNLTAEAARIAGREDPARVPALLERLQELARDALSEMRTLVRELRPASVADAGLLSFLKSHAALRERRDELRVTLAVEGEETGDPGVKELLFRTAREALNNVVRHAGVCEARLELAFGAAEATLRVIDEGTGFDPAAARRPESYGLLAMRERVEAQGGTLLVRSSPGAGTAVEVRVPLHPEGEKK